MQQFYSNVLNDYASYTYNFKLYTISRKDYNGLVASKDSLREIHKRSFEKVAVIAETGVTNLKINELSIESMPVPTEGTVVTKINFDVTQPKGFSFPESIIAAGTICGWKRLYAEPVMLLEISFTGWTHDLPGEEKGIRNNPNISTITIPIKITNVNASLDSGGARYNVEAMYGYDFMRDDISEVAGTITVDNCSTLQQFGTKFTEKLNTILESDKTNGETKPMVHAFVFEDGIGEFDLQVPESGEVPINNTDLLEVISGSTGVSYTINSGSRIPKVIEGVLATSEKAQNELKVGKDEDIVGRTFYIQPKVVLDEENPDMGHASKSIIWYVGLRSTPLPKNSFEGRSEEAYNILTNPELSSYSKQYKYYFTGENSEVVSADIDYQNLYLNKVTRYENLFANPTNTGQGVSAPQLDVENIRKGQENKASRDKFVQQFEQKHSEKGVVYVDSIDIASMATLTSINNKYQYGKHNHATSVSQGVGTQAQRVRSQDHQLMLRNIRNQMLLSAITMKLEIRGDPYWLNPFDPTTNTEGSTFKKYNLINFVMGFPNENQERGLRDDYTFSGVYMVNSVTSTFSSGRFTQKLDCLRLDVVTGDVSVAKSETSEGE